ncbi:MAG TPA: hypothetical protein DEO57_06670 [Phycisphaerales bacterium]|nr:hypothetical protein [Phycisphaerales bacterium]
MRRICTSIVATLVLAGTSSADTITVCLSGCDYQDITSALENASSGDVIEIDPEDSNYSGFTIDKNLTITINGNGATVKGTDPADQLVLVEGGATATINNLTITEGSGAGMSIEAGATVTLNKCTISDNTAAGMSLQNGATVALNNCMISDNQEDGVHSEGATVNISGCNISRNTPHNIIGPTNVVLDLRGEASPVITLENSVICGTGEHVRGLILVVGEIQISDCTDEGDLNGDGTVDAADLTALHEATGICRSDVDHNGVTDVNDLLRLVKDGWGGHCP